MVSVELKVIRAPGRAFGVKYLAMRKGPLTFVWIDQHSLLWRDYISAHDGLVLRTCDRPLKVLGDPLCLETFRCEMNNLCSQRRSTRSTREAHTSNLRSTYLKALPPVAGLGVLDARRCRQKPSIRHKDIPHTDPLSSPPHILLATNTAHMNLDIRTRERGLGNILGLV